MRTASFASLCPIYPCFDHEAIISRKHDRVEYYSSMKNKKALHLKRHIQKIFLSLIVVIFFILIFKPVQRNVFNFPLRDEEDNIITGTWVFQGKKLYSDIFFQRQPLPTVLSGTLQQFTKPNTTYLLIKRHREFVLFYSFVWIILLTIRFGPKGLAAGVTLELIKFSLLGNLYLGESLVVYPSLYIVGTIYDLFKTKSVSTLDITTLSPIAFIILFSRETLAPFIALAFLIAFFKIKKDNRKLLIWSLIFSLGVFLLLFAPFVSYTGFFKNTLFVNLFDFIPSEVSYSWQYGLISTFFLPIKMLFKPNEGFYIIAKLFSIIYIISLVYFFKLKKWPHLLLSFFLLATLNFRPAEFGTFSDGRRFLPWFSALVWLSVLNMDVIITNTKKTLTKIFIGLLLLIAFAIFILPYSFREFSLRPDTYTMWYINYSPYFDYGETIRTLSEKNDTMLAIPQEPLIYWQSQLFSSSPYFFTLDYMYQRPRVFKSVKEKLVTNPPDFLYIEGNENFKKSVNDLLDEYITVPKNSKQSYLLIRKNKLFKISQEKWESVERYGFNKPEFN